MSDDNSPPPQSTPTPSGNQNLIIGLVLGAAVLLLLVLVLQMKNGGLDGNSGGESAELEELRRDVELRRNLVNEERRRLGLPPLGASPGGETVESLAARISSDSTDLVTLVRQMEALLAEKESRLANTDTTFEALTDQNTTLKAELADLQGSAADAEALRSRLANAQTLYESAQATIEELRTQLANSTSMAEVNALRQQLEDSLTERDRLLAEVNTLTGQIETLRGENNELRYELQKVRSELGRTRLFVQSADKLPAAAKELFVELAEFETIEGAELAAEYTRVEQELGARVVDTISFPTGSARINLDKVEELRLDAQASGDKSFFLVVGYASKTGDFETNRELSADRATTIASVLDFNRKPEQNVAAVFLGQTDRFAASDPLKNQICEIWEIRE